jgi:hypothetical protein
LRGKTLRIVTIKRIGKYFIAEMDGLILFGGENNVGMVDGTDPKMVIDAVLEQTEPDVLHVPLLDLT